MGGTTHLKVKYIIARYNFEKQKLNEAQQMVLLNTWIETLTKFEEYEMAQALLNIKKHMILSMTRVDKSRRSGWQTLGLRLRILIRKIRRWHT